MKSSKYVSTPPDEKGFVKYTDEENQVWKTLYERQSEIIQNRACDEYIEGLKVLAMSEDKIPQIPDVNARLSNATGWKVEPVAALISFDRFFDLLANRKFPAATFIRHPEELEYLQEPDIFHEIYGHCPMLTHQVYADFMQAYGEIGYNASEKERVLLARLYWFTVEFGLINTKKGLRIYGGGILSSIGETVYALESNKPKRKPFDIIDILRTPYRIDIYQTVYFIIEKYEDLYNVLKSDILGKIHEAIALGEHEPSYPPKDKETDFPGC